MKQQKQAQYYVYVLEAVVIFENGITLPLMSEFLNNEEYRDVSSNKQDCERKAFYRFAERTKKRFPKLKISVTLDGRYACGPVIKTCREYGWDYMLVFNEGCLAKSHGADQAYAGEYHKAPLRRSEPRVSLD